MEKEDLAKPEPQSRSFKNPFIVLAILMVAGGVLAGFLLAGKGSPVKLGNNVQTAPGAKVTQDTIGISDEKTFRDEAEGELEKGGIEGEGSYHLVRAGGPSQNVYLTSSVINLDDFVGKKVHVWGETQKGQKAGWLMDVGKIKIIE